MLLLSMLGRRLGLVIGVAGLAGAALWVAVGPLAALALWLVVGLATFVAVPAFAARGWWRLVAGVIGAAAFLAALAVVVRVRYGSGEPYPDRSTAPVVPDGSLEVAISLDYPPGNVAIADDGRVFFCYHPFAQAHRFTPATVFELVDGAPRPFPDAAFQARYQGVFGMTVDRQRRLWFIEPAGLDHERTRLLAFDLGSSKQVFEYWFPPGAARFAQDLRVAPDGKTVYLADTGLFRFTAPGLIVFDVGAQTYRTVLTDSPTTRPQDWVIHTPFGPHKLAFGLITFAVGIDGIALSADGAWLYYGAMSHGRLFKVPTAVLADGALAPGGIERAIVAVGDKPLSDGIAMDRDGSVLLTDIEHGGIAGLDAAGKLTTLVKSPRVIWADGVVVAPDGAIVFTDSAIPAYVDQLARPPSQAKLAAARPYHIFRFHAPRRPASP
jgi:sugar lactone lactonase YvrE